jgi:hypothetical protein
VCGVAVCALAFVIGVPFALTFLVGIAVRALAFVNEVPFAVASTGSATEKAAKDTPLATP